jgi:hypothetical protein
MANLNNTSIKAGGIITPTENTLSASDVLTWDQNVAGAILVLRNGTGGALSPTITGSQAPTAYPVDGVGPQNLSAGLAVGSIPAGQTRIIPLDSRRQYFQGTITITGGTGITATILTN